jgi:hypothetical protein
LNLLLNCCTEKKIGMANPMTQMNSYYPGGAVYNPLSAASMAAAAAAAAQQSAIASLANPNAQQVGYTSYDTWPDIFVHFSIIRRFLFPLNLATHWLTCRIIFLKAGGLVVGLGAIFGGSGEVPGRRWIHGQFRIRRT